MEELKRPTSSLVPGQLKGVKGTNIPNDFNNREKGYPITFQHLGKRGYTVPLFAVSIVSRRKWIEHIETQQNSLRDRSSIFTQTVLCEKFFSQGNKVNCLVPIGMDPFFYDFGFVLTGVRRWTEVGVRYRHGYLCV